VFQSTLETIKTVACRKYPAMLGGEKGWARKWLRKIAAPSVCVLATVFATHSCMEA